MVVGDSGPHLFEPWEPIRDEAYFTVEGQEAEVERPLAQYRDREALPHVIIDECEQVVGRVTFSGITHGAFQSCSIGY